MRFFIALDLPEESKSQIQKIQVQIKELIPEIRITDKEKLHLTVAFIGEQKEYLKNRLEEAISDSVKNIHAFTLIPSYLDGFPHLHTAHTLWIGVKGDTDALYILRHHIKDRLLALGLDVDERRYTPHIAIAKGDKINITPYKEQAIEKIMSAHFTPIQVKSVKLFESIPNHGFHSHNTLIEVHLPQSL